MSSSTRSFGFKRFLGICLAALAAVLVMAPTASALPELFWGLNNGNRAYQANPDDWDAMQELGIKQFRMELNWGVVSHKGTLGIGNYDWSQYDTVFRLAAEHGVKILPILYGRKDESHLFPTEAEYAGWDLWVRLAAARYGWNGVFWTQAGHPANVTPPVAWEVWNEPNLGGNSPNGTIANPEKYVDLLKRTAEPIRSVQAGFPVSVLLGGLFWNATTGWDKEGKYFDYQGSGFLELVRIDGGGPYFDGLSLHPYAFYAPDNVAKVKESITNARLELNRFSGGSGKSIWITELGWGLAGAGAPSFTELVQASNLNSSVQWIKEVAASKNIQSFAWFDYRDIEGDRWDLHSGLRSTTGAYRTAWCMYASQIGVHPCNPSASWHFDQLGASIAGDPDIASWEPNRLDVFARGWENGLWDRYWAGSWSAWGVIGTELVSGPGAVSWGPNRIDVVGRAANNTVKHWYWASGWHVDNIGGNITSDPDIASWEPEELNVFARGAGNELAGAWWEHGSGWSSWGNLGSLGAPLGGGPTAVSWGHGRVDVFARAPDNTLEHWFWETSAGNGWQFQNLGGNITSDPDASSWGTNRLDVFAKGADNTLVHIYWDGTAWSPWQSLGGTLTSGPGAVSWGANRIDVVARGAGPSFEVLHWYWG